MSSEKSRSPEVLSPISTPHSNDDEEKRLPSDTKDGKCCETLDEHEDPKQWSTAHRWTILAVIASACTCVTCSSSVSASTEMGISKAFGISHTVAILSISLFALGLGVGPLLLGPLSEFYGRRVVYVSAYVAFLLLTIPVALANNAPVHMIFRFLTGAAGSSFLSVAGGSVSDMWADKNVATPMAVFTLSPFIGPVAGPIIGGFVNQNLDWRWTYYIFLIWIAVEVALIIVFCQETYAPVLLKRKAARLRKEREDFDFYAPLERNERGVLKTIVISCYRPFQLMAFEPMATLINLWNFLILGILYLTFQAFPIIFEQGHGFSLQLTGLTFIGLGVGMVVALLSQVFFWNGYIAKQVKDNGGTFHPEYRLQMAMVGAVVIPVGLFWLAFTTYPHVHWIVPIIASILFGIGTCYCFVGSFTFLVTAYRPYAASAMAANTFVRTVGAAAFPLFAGAMYSRLGTVGATALLAGLTTIMAPLPFIFYRIGPKLRKSSRFATH